MVYLFSHVVDKDVFAEVYRSLLSKRLLNNKSQNNELERSMISKLKLVAGTQFTSNMEGMMNDLAGQEDKDRKLREYLDKQPAKPALDFSVQLLARAFWPAPVTATISLPPAMLMCTKTAETYYKDCENRRLQWSHTMGNVAVKALYGGGKVYELGLNTCLLYTSDAADE